jgi:hypothetical protein
MTPNGDAVARFKDEADGARDVFCGWRVTFETGGNSTDEGATLLRRQQRGGAIDLVELFGAAFHDRTTVRAPAAKTSSSPARSVFVIDRFNLTNRLRDSPRVLTRPRRARA